MSIWDVELDTLRASRLLALRMHVARYVVRTGAPRRNAVAVVDDATFAQQSQQLRELMEAAGAAAPDVRARVASGLPPAEVLLVGERGAPAGAVAHALAPLAGQAVGQVWAIDAGRFALPPGPEIVDAVEWLIRIIIPEALGANGTPPPPDVAVRVR
ncbi:MAG TPA: hypothetical protein VFX49_10370 [Chloroflexota bacterium]|nr:hypothetical protein [Chloroflexota bacterium]